jgi:hypothetical protein
MWRHFRLYRYLGIDELLLNHEEVDVNYLNKSWRNALDCAKYNKHGQREGIANRLKEKGQNKI